MKKAVLALFVTLIAGCIGTAIGMDLLNDWSELGILFAVAVMGALIIYFNDKKE